MRLKKLSIISICIIMIFISSCENQKSESLNNIDEKDTHAYSYLSLDYSYMRENLNNILEDDVLEVRWIIANGEYRTINNELVYEIKKEMSKINLQPMEQIKGEMPDGVGSGEFLFLNGKKVLYRFHVDELRNVHFNGKVYSNKDEFKEIADYLIGITHNDKRIEKIE